MKKRTLVSMVTVAMVTSTLVFGCGARGSESSSENAGNAAEGVSEGVTENVPEDAEENAPEETAGTTDKKLSIGFSNWSRSFEFYVDMEAGMQEKADELGVEVIMQDANGDLTEQTKQLENFISRGVDGIIICPIDSEASGSEVKMVNDAGIPIATVDIECTGGGEILTHIASDNYLGGQLAAEYLGDALNGKGQVAVISNPTITPLIEREKGFTETIAEKYPDIEIVSNQSGESTREKGLEVAENMLEKYPELAGIFSTNDMMGLGAVQAIQAKSMDTIVVGFDATEEACNAMKEGGPMKASVAQQPKELGAQVLEAIVKAINGEDVDAEVMVEVKTISVDNVDEYTAK